MRLHLLLCLCLFVYFYLCLSIHLSLIYISLLHNVEGRYSYKPRNSLTHVLGF